MPVASINIASLQQLVSTTNYITEVTPVMQGDKEIGYTISFLNSEPVTIYHGETPQISITQQDDGNWYWTLDGKLLTDSQGNPLRVNDIVPRLSTGENLILQGITADAGNQEIVKEAIYLSMDDGKTWERTASPCTGKWRGTTDYGFVMDGRISFFVSNGMSYFEARIREWIKAIRDFQTNREHCLRLLQEQVEKDNVKASAEGLHQVRLLDIGILSPECADSYDFFTPYAQLEVNGRKFKHHTSNLSCAIVKEGLETYLKECNRKNTYTAGAVQIPDYIFCGVRFCSSDSLYKIGE